jgi:hypothetical protein
MPTLRTAAADALLAAASPPIDPQAPLAVSFGSGVDASAVLGRFAEEGVVPDLIVFAHTGNEKPATYQHLRDFGAWLAARGMPPIREITYRKESGDTLTLEQYCYETGNLPGFAMGKPSCSTKFKGGRLDAEVWRQPWARAAVAAGQRITRVIGFDASPDDLNRTKKAAASVPVAARARYRFWYPLQDWGWDRTRCITELRRMGAPVPPKSACWYCAASRPHELLELAIDHPDLAVRCVALEAQAAPAFRRPMGLWKGPRTGVRRGAGGVPALTGAAANPPTFAEYLLEWMAPHDGRAYALWLPKLRPSDTPIELAAMRHVGAVYRRLPVLHEARPDPTGLAEVMAKGVAAWRVVHAECVRLGLTVDGRALRFSDPPGTKARLAAAARAVGASIYGDYLLDAGRRRAAAAVEAEEEQEEGGAYCAPVSSPVDDEGEEGPTVPANGGAVQWAPPCAARFAAVRWAGAWWILDHASGEFVPSGPLERGAAEGYAARLNADAGGTR